MSQIDMVFEYWFGEKESAMSRIEELNRFWFMGGEEIDSEIREKFENLHSRAVSGDLDGWAETPRGRLALIIILDQFSRNLFRDRPEAFANDDRAQAIALEGLHLEMDEQLFSLGKVFFYMPLEHAENMDLQNKSVELFTKLRDDSPEPYREHFENYLDFAIKHREVIEKFGRFPGTNAALGRKSTPEEEAYLKETGSNF